MKLSSVYMRGKISTDDIIPARYKHSYTDPADLAKHVFENKWPDIRARLTSDTALVCDDIFGIGSSREQAVSALLAAHVRAVIAPNFGRIFFRNSWNLGLILLEVSREEVQGLAEAHALEIDFARSCLTPEGGPSLPYQPFDPNMVDMVRHGGLLKFVQANGGRLK